MSAAIESPPIELTESEKERYDTAVDEIGSAGDVYLPVKDGQVTAAAIAHHGLLLPAERDLIEALYQREGGVRVLAATPTLAQGMSLPADPVIIAEDSRFDTEKN